MVKGWSHAKTALLASVVSVVLATGTVALAGSGIGGFARAIILSSAA